DFGGKIVKTIREPRSKSPLFSPSYPWSGGMSLNATNTSLYAALNSGFIVRVDTTTLLESGRWAMPMPAHCASFPVPVGPRVWFSFSCRSGLGVLDTRDGRVVVYHGARYPTYQAMLRADPTKPWILYETDGGSCQGCTPVRRAHLIKYDV